MDASRRYPELRDRHHVLRRGAALPFPSAGGRFLQEGQQEVQDQLDQADYETENVHDRSPFPVSRRIRSTLHEIIAHASQDGKAPGQTPSLR